VPQSLCRPQLGRAWSSREFRAAERVYACSVCQYAIAHVCVCMCVCVCVCCSAPQLPRATPSSKFRSEDLRIFMDFGIFTGFTGCDIHCFHWSRMCVFTPQKHVFSNRGPIVALMCRTNASIGRAVCPRGIFGVPCTVCARKYEGKKPRKQHFRKTNHTRVFGIPSISFQFKLYSQKVKIEKIWK